MKFWNYIGEFILFRRVVDKLRGRHNTKDFSTKNIRDSFNDTVDTGCYDDLDVFRRNNSQPGYRNLRDDYNDWSCQSHDQSFADFHEEQDDYDMMDDY